QATQPLRTGAFAGGASQLAGNRGHWNWKRFSCKRSQNLVARNRQILHAAADRIENRVGYRGNSRYFAGFTDALRTIRAVSIVAFDKYDFDLRRVPVGEDSSAVKTGREWLPVATVIEKVFMKRHSNTHERAAFDLTSGGKRIHDPSTVVHGKVFE